MMRHALALALIFFLAWCAPRAARAQDLSFRGGDIIQLARAIAAEARRANTLPSAFELPMANGAVMRLTAPNAFELLARATMAWKANKVFPGTVSLVIHDLVGPAFDPATEPPADGLQVPVPTVDIGNYAPVWLAMAEAPGHKLLKVMNFPAGYKLTAAQLLVAMAVLIDESLRKNEVPSAIALPLVRSPRNWLDTRSPVVVSAQPQEEIILQASLRITLNGMDIGKLAPTPAGAPVAPFCGAIGVEIAGFGPVARVRVAVDGAEHVTLQGPGPHFFELDTLPLSDGVHTLSAIAIDAHEKSSAYIFSFSVMNGRQSGFTPAERTEAEIKAAPAGE